MATTFKSKIGLGLVMPLGVILTGVSVQLIIAGAWFGLVIIALVMLFIGHMLFSTYYVVSEGMINIRCGFLVDQNVAVSSIKSIRETNNVLSSPAASLDRLQIAYGKYDTVMISPKDKAGFIALLQSLKPDIEVILKQP